MDKCPGGFNTSIKNGYWRNSNITKNITKCDKP
jgi:hypothetical protein